MHILTLLLISIPLALTSTLSPKSSSSSLLTRSATTDKFQWCKSIYCNCVFGSNTMDCGNKYCNGATGGADGKGWGSCAEPSPGYTPDKVLGNVCCRSDLIAAESCLARLQYNANQGGYCTGSTSAEGSSTASGGGGSSGSSSGSSGSSSGGSSSRSSSGGSNSGGSSSGSSGSSGNPSSTVPMVAGPTKSSAADIIAVRSFLGHSAILAVLGMVVGY